MERWWSLAYEMLCYVIIGVLAVTSVLNQARRFVLFLMIAAYLSWCATTWRRWAGAARSTSSFSGRLVALPFGLSSHWFIYLGFLFMPRRRFRAVPGADCGT